MHDPINRACQHCFVRTDPHSRCGAHWKIHRSVYSAGDAEHRHRADDLDRFRRCGGATKDKTVVTDQKEEKKAEEKKTEAKVQTEMNEELIKTRTERDIFKKMYEQITERLIGGIKA